MTAVTHLRPDSRIIFSAASAASFLHCPILLEIITRKDSALDAICIVPNLRLIILSLDAVMSAISQVMGLRT